jgi:hypothetical protein
MQVGLARQDRHLEDVVAGMDRGLVDARQAFRRRAAEALLAEFPYLDRVRDRTVVNWIQTDGETRESNHGLLGAYYLHAVCASSTVPARVRLQAVRAVLLHDAPTVPISIEQDPCAAVLSLCNEMFDWDPARPASVSPSALARAFHVPPERAVPVASPFSEVRCSAARVVVAANGKLSVRLSQAPLGSASGPTLDVRLEPSLTLETPAYTLWLQKAQRLGRLRRTSWGLAPALILRGDVHPEVLGLKRDTFEVLESTVLVIRPPLRRALIEWLERQAQIRGHLGPRRDGEEPPVAVGFCHLDPPGGSPLLAFDPSVDLTTEMSHLDEAVNSCLLRWSGEWESG